MDADIQFGDVEETQPERQLRPDRNKHFAVVAYESPDESQLPVFLDLDVMRDMEVHAASDKTVELGGVLLGGQFEDEDGKPFVVISDSLRAEHYESTKGSFKFTHDTWSKISRERDEFPDDLQMVGWYHTHPDWGVFLSGMDMFICDNFFNRPLDVAYVIDPCRLDRAFFEWTGDPGQRIRRLGGFYVTTSRFRRDELEFYTTQLESGIDMSNQQFGGVSQPVVHIHEQRQTWQPMAILGMLSIQFLFLALIGWKLITNDDKGSANRALLNEIQTKDAVLDTLVRAIPDAKKGFKGILQKEREENAKLSSTAKGLAFRVDQLEDDQKKSDEQVESLKKELKKTEKSYEKSKAVAASRLKKISDLKNEMEDGGDKVSIWKKWGLPIGIGIVAGLLVVVGFSASTAARADEEREFAQDKLDKESMIAMDEPVVDQSALDESALDESALDESPGEETA